MTSGQRTTKHISNGRAKTADRQAEFPDDRLLYQNEIKLSLKTDSLQIAVKYYDQLHSEIENLFALHRYESAPINLSHLAANKQAAQNLGFSYQSGEELIASGNINEILKRGMVLKKSEGSLGDNFDALFGTIQQTLNLSDAYQIWTKAIADELMGMSHREKQKKLNPKKSAMKSLFDVIGDKPFKEVNRADANKFRAHLIDRVTKGEIVGDSANKALIHVRKVFNDLIQLNDWEINNPFAKLKIEGKKQQRSPFSKEWIAKHMLKDETFDGLNHELKCLALVMMETGAVQKELCFLDPQSDLFLEAEIPFVHIRPNKYRTDLKTTSRSRKIPLVGLAFEAMKSLPDGFKSYRRENGPEAASAAMMKHFKKKKILPSPKHTMYSFRHSFKDRLREAKMPEEMQNYVMGHKQVGMGASYGDGYTLKAIREFLDKE